MEPILAGEISVAYEWRPRYRPYNQEDGVGCAACHLRSDGSVACSGSAPDAPCRPVGDPRIATPEFCGACHNPSHDAYFEWKQSRYSAQGVACGDCHTKKVLRVGADGRSKVGVSHRWRGGFDREFVVGNSIRARTVIEGDSLVMRVHNLTGHKFPGEVPSRAFIIQMEFFDQENLLHEDFFNLRRPFKSEVGNPDNRLLPDESREFRYAIPEGARRVRVSYLFKPTPFAMPQDWFVLDLWEGVVP